MPRPAAMLAAVLGLVLTLAGCGMELPGMLRSDPASSTAPASTASSPPQHTVAPPEPSPSSRHRPTTPGTEAPTSSAPASSAAPQPAPGTRVVDASSAIFTSPTGRIICAMDPSHVRCDYLAEPEWTAPKPADCNLGGSNSLIVDTTARVACAGDTLAGSAQPGSPQTSWFVEALDTTSNLNGVAQAALGYDQRLRLGDFECLSETKGVTCTNTATGATLFISRESYQLS